jgi:predicted nucleic acid-binding protein
MCKPENKHFGNLTNKKYLLDTCIWRDFYEDRFSKINRPLGKYAHDLFMKIIKNKSEIYFSDIIIRELKKDYSNQDINEMLTIFFMNNALIRVNISKEEHLEAKKLSKERNLPYADCLIAIQARNYNTILVSQDAHLINDLKDIVKCIRPEKI